MQRLTAALVLACSLLLCTAALASSWPTFHGPNQNRISPETGINTNWAENPPEQLWQTAMSDNGYAGHSVAEGKVFIIDQDGDQNVVRAINLETGENVWTFSYPDSGRANYGFARSTPVVEDGKVYTISRLGLVHRLNAEDGSKDWVVDMREEFGGRLPRWQYSMSPLIDGDHVILVPGGPNAGVAAINKETGETVWRGGGGDVPGYTEPVVATIDGVKQYVVFTARNLIGVRAEDGELLWRHPWRTPNDVNAATPIVRGNEIFITTGYNRGCALVRVTNNQVETVWENKAIHSHFNTGLYYDGHIYSSSDRGRLVCVEWDTGETRWEQRGSVGKGGIVGVDGHLIGLQERRGTVFLVELTPERYNEVGQFDGLGDQSWTAPIVAEGRLIIRNRSTLACYKLK